jgi:hypothetical protein
MRTRQLGLMFAILALSGYVMPEVTAAGGKLDAVPGYSDTATPLTETYTWHDGERTRTIWLNPRRIAEFDSPVGEKNVVGRIYPQAKPLNGLTERKPGVRVWRVEPDARLDARVMMKTLTARAPGARFSPVFHDGPSSGSRMRAMPGNVIIYPKQRWNAELAGRWAAAHDLEIVRFLDIGPGVIVVRTAPGLAALELANTLSEYGDVSAAFPDWWQEAVVR